MRYYHFVLFAFLLIGHIGKAFSYSFNDTARKIKAHPQVKSLIEEMKRIGEEGQAESSWGDPKLGINARNFPVQSLANDETPMTGVEVSLSQNFPLSFKYSHIEDSYKRLALATKHQAEEQKRALLILLWNLAATKRKLTSDLAILKENIQWVENMLKVSKRLYANGKLSQQALLELQIRKSELEAQTVNVQGSLSQTEAALSYLGSEGELELASVPWSLLEEAGNKKAPAAVNPAELALVEKTKAAQEMVKAKTLNYIPDVTLSAGYVKRNEDIDDVGDFVGAGISLSLPLSSKRYAQKDAAVAASLKAASELRNYRVKRLSELAQLESEIHQTKKELEIVEKRSLVFAKSSREITAKAYGLGNATYIELLQAELKYQDLLMKRNALQARLTSKNAAYLYLRGDSLHGK